MTKTKRKGLSHRERMAMAQTTAYQLLGRSEKRKTQPLYDSKESEESNRTAFSLYYIDFTWLCHFDATS